MPLGKPVKGGKAVSTGTGWDDPPAKGKSRQKGEGMKGDDSAIRWTTAGDDSDDEDEYEGWGEDGPNY